MRLGSRSQSRDGAPRSHLSDGRSVWLDVTAGTGWAVDAELALDPPEALVRRHGAPHFWSRWTRTECAAKLAGVPIVVWLARHGLDEPDPRRFELHTTCVPGQDGAPDVVVTLGRVALRSPAAAAP